MDPFDSTRELQSLLSSSGVGAVVAEAFERENPLGILPSGKLAEIYLTEIKAIVSFLQGVMERDEKVKVGDLSREIIALLNSGSPREGICRCCGLLPHQMHRIDYISLRIIDGLRGQILIA